MVLPIKCKLVFNMINGTQVHLGSGFHTKLMLPKIEPIKKRKQEAKSGGLITFPVLITNMSLLNLNQQKL